MKKIIQLKLLFAALVFTLPLAVVADDAPQMGNMMHSATMATNSMEMNDMSSNTMHGMDNNSMSGMSSNSMSGMAAHLTNSVATNSMNAVTTNSMNSMSPAPANSMNPGSMMAPHRPSMNVNSMSSRHDHDQCPANEYDGNQFDEDVRAV